MSILTIALQDERNRAVLTWEQRLQIATDAAHDPRREGEVDRNSMRKALETAMACVPSNPLRRPTVSEVVGELNECLEMGIASGRDLEMAEISKITSGNGTDFLSDTLDLDYSLSFPQAR
ncbi:hypothetical protein Acr_16g0008460 [Actinidia rufa]|uniref:Leucine-rich repeat protein kinase family protein n=1 Tax=Actinidia rufa TaxID=165716 RepID=A0A7J0FZV0_9ERIC|nr:hypothetical protein Acr_16g0008460 [Actinidia rufa]